MITFLAAFLLHADPVVHPEGIVFHTNRGIVTVELWPEIAPKHVDQVLRLAAAGVYDGTLIYRVERGFVAQLDGWEAKQPPVSEAQRQLITKLPAEFGSTPHERGVLSMARADDDPNSAETSFSFVLGPAPHLDGKYTVFGRVIAGSDVVSDIEAADVDAGNRPRREIRIERAEVVHKPRAEMSASLKSVLALLLLLAVTFASFTYKKR